MTEHSKIPVPPEGDKPEGEGSSLFERAVQTFKLGGFAPPPVPEALAPTPPRLAKRMTRPLADIPGPEPVSSACEPAAPEPEVPEAVVPPLPRADAPVSRSAEVPVDFGGVRHSVSRQHLRDQGLIVPDGAVTAALEEFRIVKRQLLQQVEELSRQGAGAAGQRILISSPLPGEGKTYCSVNLALSIAAEKECEVLLVDADFGKPSVLSTLGLPGGRGLMDALIDPAADVADFVIGTDIPGLWVLPAGDTTSSDSEYLNSSRTPQVLDRLTQGAPRRIVLFDSPPALAASPAAVLAKHVGQVVVVVRADRTGQGALEDAISLLSACPNIELLLNGTHFSPSGRRFGSYYGYGG